MRGSLVPDRTIIQDVVNKLARGGIGAPCRVTVQSRNGEVTLAGSVQFVHQQQSALRIATGVNGVRRVASQLIVKAPVKR